MIKQWRQREVPILVLDAGDALIRDRTPAISSEGKTSIDLLNKMGYDAMALGEGDLQILGLAEIRQRIEEASFPVLSANVFLAGTRELLAEPYMIREFEAHRVAVIGLTGVITLDGVEIQDPLQAAHEAVLQVRDQADIIILLSHAGLAANRQIAHEVPDVDLIISGGGQDHTDLAERLDNGVVLVHADVAISGHAGRRIGVGSWYWDQQGKLADFEWQTAALSPNIDSDPDMEEWVRQHP